MVQQQDMEIARLRREVRSREETQGRLVGELEQQLKESHGRLRELKLENQEIRGNLEEAK